MPKFRLNPFLTLVAFSSPIRSRLHPKKGGVILRQVISITLALAMIVAGGGSFLSLLLHVDHPARAIAWLSAASVFGVGLGILYEDIMDLRAKKSKAIKPPAEQTEKQWKDLDYDDIVDRRDEIIDQILPKLVETIEIIVKAQINGDRETCLAEFIRRIDTALTQEDHSPVLVARVMYSRLLQFEKIRRNEVSKGTHDLIGSEWKSRFRDYEVGDADIQFVIDEYLDQYLGSLSAAGQEICRDRADALEKADKLWRAKYPEKAASESLDDPSALLNAKFA
jgi:hypothetical protein